MVSNVARMNVRFSGGIRKAEGMNGGMGDRRSGRDEGCVWGMGCFYRYKFGVMLKKRFIFAA